MDKVTLINELDEVLGSMDKIEAHRGDGLLHRAISVFLIRQQPGGATELLLQQRSPLKIVGGLQWANTACGNVWPGESYLACAHRRLSHELGIAVAQALIPVTKFSYHARCNQEFSEFELDQVFVGKVTPELPLNPHPDEVLNYRWERVDAVVAELLEDQRRQLEHRVYVPWMHIMYEREIFPRMILDSIRD